MKEQVLAASKPGVTVRYATDENGARLDEVVVHSPALIHFEQMDDGHWWVRIDRLEGDALVLDFWTKKNKRIHAKAEWD